MLIFDFDGTLVDVWKRYYEIFRSWWPININLDTFKKLKWNFENETEILAHLNIKYTKEESLQYKAYKKQKLEEKEYLSLDSRIINPELIENLRVNYIILTLRRNPENYFWQLEKLGLSKLLKDRSVVLQPKGIDSKLEWIVSKYPKSLLEKEEELIIVGDSETDLKLADISKLLKIKSIVYLVKTGLKDPNKTTQKMNLNAITIENVNFLFEKLRSMVQLN